MDDEGALHGGPLEIDADRWAGRGRGLLIRGLFLSGHELPGWDLVSTRPSVQHDDRRYLSSTWVTRERTGAAVQCDLVECASARRAQETMAELLAEIQGPMWAEAEDGSLGDVGFMPRDVRTLGAVLVRANVVIRVLNNERELVEVDDLARNLDDLVAGEPQPWTDGVVPVIESVRAGGGRVGPAERVPLLVDVRDPLDRDVWLKYVVDGGDLEVVEDDVLFTAPDEGSYEIRVYATNPNGGIAADRTEVVVG